MEISLENLYVDIGTSRVKLILPQAAQTHVGREGCNVIYIT